MALDTGRDALTPLTNLLIFLAIFGCAHTSSAPTEPNLGIGRLFMEGLNGKNFAQVKEDAKQGRIGGVIVFGSAYKDAEDLKNKIAAIRASTQQKIIFALDGEGGNVLRLPGLVSASANEMGGKGNQFTYAEAHKIAQRLIELGIDLNLAPVVDISAEAANPIAQMKRTFSDDPKVVSARAKEFIRAHSELGIRTVLKHFPGHGSSREDSHLDWVDVSDKWKEDELLPYREILSPEYHGAVMAAHIVNARFDKQYPASLSRLTLQVLLRERMKFTGVLITDDLQMGAISRHFTLEEAVRLAIDAGNDFLLVGQQYRNTNFAILEEWITGEVKAGRISMARIRQSQLRLQAL